LEVTIESDLPLNQLELLGPADAHLRILKEALAVKITARNRKLIISGEQKNVQKTAKAVDKMKKLLDLGHSLNEADVTEILSSLEGKFSKLKDSPTGIQVYSQKKTIKPKTKGQLKYVETMIANDLTFCIGPAGTGKTYLAVAVAVSMLRKKQIRRIILARPAVEAGEKLGFLPGDLQAKVNPEDMMDFPQMKKFMELDIIEIIPLAFMRGRTLNGSVVICDEAQNTSPMQMLMILTRLGQGSKMIITGDITQIDLESGQRSGMVEAIETLRRIKGIGYAELEQKDIVRHHLVQKIVKAYKKLRNSKTIEKDQSKD
jgi:phosphate starvation-inducible PhoH-like protein